MTRYCAVSINSSGSTMLRFGRFLTALASIAALLVLSAPAFAASTSGTHAWSSEALTLRSGPGLAYDVTGDIAADLPIKVLRCQELWCVVDGEGGRGWTDRNNIVFGLTSDDFPYNLNPDYASGGPGSICFYQGSNYSGDSLCVRSGRVIHDLALLGLDNSFASVKVEGSVSAAACRDRGFQSYCERITASQPALDPYLRRNLSSIRVY